MILGNPVNNQLVADRVGSILEMVSSRSSNQVTIVAVTKGFGVDAIKAAAKAGIYDIGENYAQEMMKKRDSYDQNRQHSPLSIAKDAICIDTTDLSLNEQVDKIINIIKKAKEQKK